MIQTLSDLKTVRFNEQADGVIILDQTLLPGKEAYLTLTTAEEIWDAIYKLKVRGAPAIGVAAAYGIYVCARRIDTAEKSVFVNEFRKIKEYLAGSRPTAVNLVAALNRMERVLVAHPTLSVPEWKELLYKEAIAIPGGRRRRLPADRRELSGATPSRDGESLRIVTPDIWRSRSMAPLWRRFILGQERGYGFKVFADETRPLLQGARLTAYELSRAGVDVTLICDNMASVVMRKGWVHAVVVGCDRVAANGDVANKIGTSGVAILARHYKIPFYVLGPTSTIDGSCPDGDSIVIEERNPDEVTEMWYSRRMAPKDVKVYNPAFDITPHELITAIITEKGIFYKNNR